MKFRLHTNLIMKINAYIEISVSIKNMKNTIYLLEDVFLNRKFLRTYNINGS